jgi:hypothetical protein
VFYETWKIGHGIRTLKPGYGLWFMVLFWSTTNGLPHPFAGAKWQLSVSSVLCSSIPRVVPIIWTHLVLYIYFFISIYVYTLKYDIIIALALLIAMSPLQHMSQITEVGNSLFFDSTHNTHNPHNAAIYTCCYYQTTTMTGHKDGSHKKRKVTRLEDSALKRSAKILRVGATLASPTVAPAVTQTPEESPVIPDSPTNLSLVATSATTDCNGYSFTRRKNGCYFQSSLV